MLVVESGIWAFSQDRIIFCVLEFGNGFVLQV